MNVRRLSVFIVIVCQLLAWAGCRKGVEPAQVVGAAIEPVEDVATPKVSDEATRPELEVDARNGVQPARHDLTERDRNRVAGFVKTLAEDAKKLDNRMAVVNAAGLKLRIVEGYATYQGDKQISAELKRSHREESGMEAMREAFAFQSMAAEPSLGRMLMPSKAKLREIVEQIGNSPDECLQFIRECLKDAVASLEIVDNNDAELKNIENDFIKKYRPLIENGGRTEWVGTRMTIERRLKRVGAFAAACTLGPGKEELFLDAKKAVFLLELALDDPILNQMVVQLEQRIEDQVRDLTPFLKSGISENDKKRLMWLANHLRDVIAGCKSSLKKSLRAIDFDEKEADAIVEHIGSIEDVDLGIPHNIDANLVGLSKYGERIVPFLLQRAISSEKRVRDNYYVALKCFDKDSEPVRKAIEKLDKIKD